MSSLPLAASRVAELRRAFDQARAAPFASSSEEQTESLLAIRLAGEAYAIKVEEITGLANRKRIVPVPSAVPELLGLAGVRGVFVPVYGLQGLLGHATLSDEPDWLALCGREEPFALAFGGFEGYLRIPKHQLHPVEWKDSMRMHIRQVVRAQGAVRSVVSIPLIGETIRGRCGTRDVPKEP